MKQKRMHVGMPVELFERAKAEAGGEGNVNEFVREALRLRLDLRTMRLPDTSAEIAARLRGAEV
jgi:hypothetical protein